jgi:hypothetical protein
MVGGIQPDPTPAEVAAIVAAIELAWPRVAEPAVSPVESRWRFSGRPWRREDGWSTRGG